MFFISKYIGIFLLKFGLERVSMVIVVGKEMCWFSDKEDGEGEGKFIDVLL